MNKLKVKLNPALVKDLGDDKLLCLICNAQVKAKIWTAHSNGKKHHENIEALKKKRSVQVTAPLVTSKRRQSENDTLQQADSVISKRSRIETVTNATVSQKSEVPPWQRDQADGVEQSVAKPSSSKKIIEGVPEGFFDDEKLNSRVAETIEKQANMEVEYANFMSELDQAKRDEEVKGDEEDESSAIEKDIEQIDEQIDRWKRVNEFEIRREEVLHKPSVEVVPEEPSFASDDDDNVPDLDEISSWRSKGVIG